MHLSDFGSGSSPDRCIEEALDKNISISEGSCFSCLKIHQHLATIAERPQCIIGIKDPSAR